VGVLIHVGDCLDILPTLPAESVQTCVTSPPYFGLRDYGCDGQIGLEPTPDEFVAALVAVFREVRRVLRDDGTLWLNLGDSYANDGKWGGSSGGKHASALHGRTSIGRGKVQTGLKPKDLIGIPWRAAFALQADGWYLRQDIIWHKPNPMPESVTDRCTKAHEYMFLLSKSGRYYWNAEAMRERAVAADIGAMDGGSQRMPDGSDANDGRNFRGKRDSFKREDSKRAQPIPGQTVGTHRAEREESAFDIFTRNKRSVWTVPTMPFREAHFATFPEALIRPCIEAGSRPGDLVLDPFMGAGTTAVVCERLSRRWVGCELNPDYAAIAERRIRAVQPGLPLALSN
jgi:DNA modification methylase